MATTIYGIPNCDTVKKARKWCDSSGVTYRFVDLRENPVGVPVLAAWLNEVGEALLNRRSTTWKQLTADQRADAESDAALLMNQYPTLIKRPVLVHEGRVSVGFKPDKYAALFGL